MWSGLICCYHFTLYKYAVSKEAKKMSQVRKIIRRKAVNIYSFLSGLQKQNCLERVIPYRKQKYFCKPFFCRYKFAFSL